MYTKYTPANVETAMCLWEAFLSALGDDDARAREFIDPIGAVEARHTIISWVAECEAAWEADRAAGTELVPYDWEHCPAFLERKLGELV
jgi:hypothetical protein